MAARTVPTAPQFLAGQKLTATGLNLIGNWMNFWANPPEFRAYQTVVQTGITSGSDVQITPDTLSWDSDSGRSGTTPYAYIVPAGMGGRWQITVSNAWASNATGMRVAAVRVNGAVPPGRAYIGIPAVSGNITVVTVVTRVLVNAGDVIAPYGYQSSGGVLSTYSDANVCSFFEGHLESLATP